MDSKQVTYLSIVISSFFVGHILGLGPILGAPLSLVTLAYFSHVFNKRLVAEVFVMLMAGNVLLDLPSWLMFITVGQNYFAFIGAKFLDWLVIVFIFVGVGMGRYLAYGTAKKIIGRSKLWQRYPLT